MTPSDFADLLYDYAAINQTTIEKLSKRIGVTSRTIRFWSSSKKKKISHKKVIDICKKLGYNNTQIKALLSPDNTEAFKNKYSYNQLLKEFNSFENDLFGQQQAFRHLIISIYNELTEKGLSILSLFSLNSVVFSFENSKILADSKLYFSIDTNSVYYTYQIKNKSTSNIVTVDSIKFLINILTK